jgi:prepilin signal peptidase PulO-like enzyme (type II secretory pathway)
MRAVMLGIGNVYAVKMAGVFMISLAAISLRTGVMPRGLTLPTFVLAVGLLLSVGSSPWVVLIFPAWVCAVSGHILASNLRSGAEAPRSAGSSS